MKVVEIHCTLCTKRTTLTHVYTCYETLVSFDCQNQNMCETKNDGMKNEPINIKNELHNKCKKITWIF
jgi:hypothetical protein